MDLIVKFFYLSQILRTAVLISEPFFKVIINVFNYLAATNQEKKIDY